MLNRLLLNLNKASEISFQYHEENTLIKQIRGRIAENLIYLSEIYCSEKFLLNVSRKEIGEMTAISEENTVRLLSEFSREKVISINGKEIEILDMPLLRKICEVC
jgi:CRP/FNR family transcriptional regulator